MYNIITMTTTAAGEPQAGTGSMFLTLLLPIGMLVLMYFILIRPQRKQEKTQKAQRSKLAVGDNVVTIGGMTGKVVNIKDDDITIATSVANTLVTYRRDSINSVQKPVSGD